jgi:hypothetical protein
MPGHNFIFRTSESEEQYLELYETIPAKWNVPIEP